MAARRKTNKPATFQQPAEIRSIEDCVDHVGVAASRLLDGEVVATTAGDGVHARR